MINHTFEGKKPSKAQVIKQVNIMKDFGVLSFELSWGENYMTFERFNNRLIGYGFIKNISASDIADTLNK
jgi:hypothetical protein